MIIGRIEMADTFKEGDVVQLKSGGPIMTVIKVANNASGELRVWCVWFDNKQVEQSSTFPPSSLDTVD